MKFIVTKASEQPNQLEFVDPLTTEAWPEFMRHDPIANKNWGYLYTRFAEYQFTFTDRENNEIVAIANTIPFYYYKKLSDFPQAGWDFVFEKGVNDFEKGLSPNIISALQIVVTKNYLGKGISKLVLQEMRNIAIEKKISNLIAPVRPNLKPLYPIIPIEEYITWKNKDGKLFDAWLRVHESIGGKIVKVCHEAMRIPGTVTDWEEWTKMKLPATGRYTIPGALLPVEINVEKNEGMYIEPNVLMVHKVDV